MTLKKYMNAEVDFHCVFSLIRSQKSMIVITTTAKIDTLSITVRVSVGLYSVSDLQVRWTQNKCDCVPAATSDSDSCDCVINSGWIQ